MFDSPEFQALRREYVQGILERCEQLRAYVRQLRAGEPVDLREIRQEVHKCRGSAGFYGFPSLTQAAAAAEDQLVMVIDGEAPRDDATLSDLVEAVVAAAESCAREVGLSTDPGHE
jgi:HPt (histidine-containing phosphotransfer) domain-containing protein